MGHSCSMLLSSDALRFEELFKAGAYYMRGIFRLIQLNTVGIRTLVVSAAISLLGTVSEIALISAAGPLIALIAGQDMQDYSVTNKLPTFFQREIISRAYTYGWDLKSIAIGLFIGLVILASVSRLFSLYINSYLGSRVASSISSKLYKGLIYSDLTRFGKFKEHQISSIVTIQLANIAYSTSLALNLLSAVLISIAVTSVLVFIEPGLTLFTVSVIFVSYLLVGGFSRARLRRNSSRQVSESIILVKLIKDTFGMYPVIKVDNREDKFVTDFSASDSRLRKSNAESAFFGAFPRYVIEATALGALGIGSIFINRNLGSEINHTQNLIESIGILLLGFQRLLPPVQSIYGSWSGIQSRKKSIQIVLEALRKTAAGGDSERTTITNRLMTTQPSNIESIELTNISHPFLRHSDQCENNLQTNPKSSHEISHEFKRGVLNIISGGSGTGKSTLLNIILRLVHVESGKITVKTNSGEAWDAKDLHSIYSYAPQKVYLTVGSVLDNIRLSEPIDLNRLETSLKLSCCSQFINTLPDGYNTPIGEGGYQLSGGQQQRIGLARAIYQNKSILCLDEPSSALDKQTEKELFTNLYSLSSDHIVIVVTHSHDVINPLLTNVLYLSN